MTDADQTQAPRAVTGWELKPIDDARRQWSPPISEPDKTCESGGDLDLATGWLSSALRRSFGIRASGGVLARIVDLVVAASAAQFAPTDGQVGPEAESRYPLNGMGGMVDGIQTHCRAAFIAGAEWRAALLDRLEQGAGEVVAWKFNVLNTIVGTDQDRLSFEQPSCKTGERIRSVTPLYAARAPDAPQAGVDREAIIQAFRDGWEAKESGYGNMADGQALALETFENNSHLFAAAPPAASRGWRPIADAPKDGTMIWACEVHPDPKFRTRHYEGRFETDTLLGGLLSGEESPRFHNRSANRWAKPTHWMPLPVSPGGSGDE